MGGGGSGSGSGARATPEVREGGRDRSPQGQRAGGARRCPGGTPNWGCFGGPGPTLGRRGKQTTRDPLIHFCPPPASSLGPRSFPPSRRGLSGGMRVPGHMQTGLRSPLAGPAGRRRRVVQPGPGQVLGLGPAGLGETAEQPGVLLRQVFACAPSRR